MKQPAKPAGGAIEFQATTIELDDSVGFIGLLNETSGRYLWLQPEDTSEGMSAKKSDIWIERDDQAYGGSGDQWKIVLTRDSLTLNAGKFSALKCSSINVKLAIDDDHFEDLTRLLRHVMRDCLDDLTIMSHQKS